MFRRVVYGNVQLFPATTGSSVETLPLTNKSIDPETSVNTQANCDFINKMIKLSRKRADKTVTHLHPPSMATHRVAEAS